MGVECLQIDWRGVDSGHPWISIDSFQAVSQQIEDGRSLHLTNRRGESLGCGVFDRNDASAAWRRYSLAEDTAFDEGFVGNALVESIQRRAEESCLRLVSSDADYLPGLIVEYYDGVVDLTCGSIAIENHLKMILEILRDQLSPGEIVIRSKGEVFTQSGQNLKPRWVEIDDIWHRIDLLNSEKACVFLDQREQHALVGSLCDGRSVLDAFSHSGGFALHASRADAARVVAVEIEAAFAKGIGAAAQKNSCFIEVVTDEAISYLQRSAHGEFDCVVFDPPGSLYFDNEAILNLHRQAFAKLPQGGVLATYCRDSATSAESFVEMVSHAAGLEGRDGRIFAQTTQPFDFPALLSFPESRVLKGLILQVE